ncbi:MAG: pitrilysin family protein, partial [Candidatus Sumerlaeota bacterium]|nr:pitrilysin family protein [Candidatus Sumerlaeota bacterium]
MKPRVRLPALRSGLSVAAAALACAVLVSGASAQSTQPRPTMQTLANGMRLIVAPRDWNRVLALDLIILGGSADDPPGRGGLANLTQNLLIKGTALRSADRIAEEIEAVGGQIHVSTSEDYGEVYTETVVEDLPLALDLLADVTLHPVFPADEVEKERALALSRIRRVEDDPFEYTYREFIKTLYRGHPYGHPVIGEAPSVQAITRDDIVAFHARRCRPEQFILAACGAVNAEALASAVDRAFAGFEPSAVPSRIQARKTALPQFANLTLRKECQQAFILTGFPAVSYGSSEYPVLRVANAALGEGMSARLFKRLRDERSLAYDVGSAVVPRLLGGHMILWIGTSPKTADAARLGLLGETRALA